MTFNLKISEWNSKALKESNFTLKFLQCNQTAKTPEHWHIAISATDLVMVAEPGNCRTGPLQLPAGGHEYSFQYKLPQNLPSSFESQDICKGRVHYMLRARLDSPDENIRQSRDRTFIVLSILDLNREPKTVVGARANLYNFCSLSTPLLFPSFSWGSWLLTPLWASKARFSSNNSFSCFFRNQPSWGERSFCVVAAASQDRCPAHCDLIGQGLFRVRILTWTLRCRTLAGRTYWHHMSPCSRYRLWSLPRTPSSDITRI